MTATSVLFPSVKTSIAKDKTGVGAIVFDATLTEVYRLNSNVTQHPVEDGAQIVDHIQTQPLEIEIVGVISNTPLPFVTVDTALLRSFITPKRAEDFYDRLIDLQKRGQLVIVATMVDVWEDMAITSVQLDRDPQSANVVQLRVSFREVIKATALAFAKALAKTSKKNAEKAKLGAQAASKSASKAVVTPTGASVASQIFGKVLGGR